MLDPKANVVGVATTKMPCGGTPVPDGFGQRCNTCFAVIGSVGQPRQCVELNKQHERDVQRAHASRNPE